MKIVQINAVSGIGSTGRIVEDLSSVLNKYDFENYIYYSIGNTKYKNSIKYMTDFEVKFNAFKSKLLGNYGFNSKHATKILIEEINKIKPDVIHLHNLHGHNINLKLFFKYLKSINVKLVWTFHDCWAFTGYCTYFDYIQCEKWKLDCKSCPVYK